MIAALVSADGLGLLQELKPLLELGGLGLFAWMVYREQVAMRKALHGLRSDFSAFFSKIMDRNGGRS